MGEWVNLPHSRVHPHTNDPFLWVIDHTYELAKYVFVRVIACLEFGVTAVAVTNCKLHVHLRFGGLAFGIAEFGNECRCVAPLAPCLRNVLRKQSATNDESGRLEHIARRREISCSTHKHAVQS